MISAKDELTDCLRGMPEHERSCFAQLSGIDLTNLARAEMHRRVANRLQLFSSEILAGLMEGDSEMHKTLGMRHLE